MKNPTPFSHTFRTLFLTCGCLLLALLAQQAHGAEGMPYAEVWKSSLFTRPETIEGKKYLAGYLQTAEPQMAAFDPEKANLRMELPDGTVSALRVIRLADIPLDKRTEEDIVSIEEKYTHKAWVPLDNRAYKGAVIKHDLGKGNVLITFRRNWNNPPADSPQTVPTAPDAKK